MDREQEVIHKQMEDTRSDLTNKLSALEAQVNTTVQATTDAVQSTTDAVTGTVESVKETVENVSEKLHNTVAGVTETVQETVAGGTDSVQQAVEGVKESVEETVKSVAETFNLKLQCERHPWIVFGGAVTVGCLGSMMLGGSRRQTHPTSQSWSPSQVSHEAAEAARARASSSQAQPEQAANADQSGVGGWLWEKLGNFKGVAGGAMMGVVRDVVSQALPENLKERVSEEVDKLTKSLGGEPIQGSLLPEQQSEESEQPQDQGQEQPSRLAGKERSETTAGRGNRPALAKNGR